MNIIVCVDDHGGMLFNGRRQSRDSVLREQARLLAKNEPLWMNAYSANQFAEDGIPVVVDEAFLVHAPENGWCFVEDCDITPYLHRIEKIALYRWNRLYPSDRKFPLKLLDRWEMISSREFGGSAHECITEEVYRS